jgi:hypothetical protein
MDLVIREFERVRLEQLRDHEPRFGLTERRAYTGPWTATKRNVGERWGFTSVCETLRAERFSILPNGRITVCEID